jgi:hypothetical protein
MEENRTDQEIQEQEILQQEVQEQPVYRPRPKWQLITAWAGIGIVLVGFILYCLHIAGIGI